MPLHAQMKYVGAVPLITVLDKTAPLLSSNGNQVIIDDWIDLAEWGVIASSSLCYLDAWVEKNVAGEWVPVILGAADQAPPDFPGIDPQGYTVLFSFLADSLDVPVLDIVEFGGTTEYGNWAGTDPRTHVDNISFTHPDMRLSRIRAVAKADCSSGTHDDKNYRFRMRVRVPDMCVWSKEVEIPATDGQIFLDEPLISLTDLGVSSFASEVAMVALIRRNGKTIRVNDSRQSLDNETFDPPSYPIQIYANVVTPNQHVYDPSQNGSPAFYNCKLYGDGNSDVYPYGVKAGGSWLGGGLGQCTEFINDTIKIAAWRDGAAYTTYIPSKGASEVAVPGGSADGCTLLIKIFRAAPYLTWVYPFNQAENPYCIRVPSAVSGVPAKYVLDQEGLVVDPNNRLKMPWSGPHALLADVTTLGDDLRKEMMLVSDPVPVPTGSLDYAPTYSDGRLSYETWTETSGSILLKRKDYTYASGLVDTEITKVYNPLDGTTVIAQTTVTYSYTAGRLSGYSCTRDV